MSEAEITNVENSDVITLLWRRWRRLVSLALAVVIVTLINISVYSFVASTSLERRVQDGRYGKKEESVTTFSPVSLNVSVAMRTAGAQLAPKHFAPIMTDAERVVMATTVRALTDTLDAANITYHMCGGTLIGSYRHHGMVPWDDDVDIYVRWSDRRRIESAVRRLMGPDYVLVKASTRWKIFSKRLAVPIKGWKWNYPFVDVCFTVENKSHVWDYDVVYGGKFRYTWSTVYPLRRRPFMNMSLWAPNDVKGYLRTTYDVTRCNTNLYIHKIEVFAKKVHSVDCRKLWPYYGFVFRSQVAGNQSSRKAEVVREELRIGDRVMSIVEFHIT